MVHVCAGAVQESLLPAPDVLLPVPVHRLPNPCHLQPQGLPSGQDQLFRKGVLLSPLLFVVFSVYGVKRGIDVKRVCSSFD